MTSSHHLRALEYLSAVQAAQDALREEYAKPTGYRDQTLIAGLHQSINYGYKGAEVNALLSIATEIELARGDVEDISIATVRAVEQWRDDREKALA